MRFLIADDHAVVRRGIQQIIATRADWRVVAEVADAEEVLPTLRREAVDAVVLDVSLRGRSGIDVLIELRREFPALPVLMLSIHAEKQYAIRCLRAGATGYLQKDSAPEELLAALERITSGRTYVTDDVASQLADLVGRRKDGPPHEALSAREFEVFRLIAAGGSVGQIAESMHLSVKTISTYRTRILQKTGMRTNADIIAYAVRNGIVT